MVTIALMAIILGVWTNCLRTQRSFVREVEELGGHAWNVDYLDGGAIKSEYPTWLPVWLKPMAPRRLNYVYLTGESIRDEHIELALRLQPLEGLNISGSRISDQGLFRLHSCQQLRQLQLFDVPTISESGIQQFHSAVPNCEILR